MPQTKAAAGKLDRIETLLRVLGFVIVAASAIGSQESAAKQTLVIGIGLLAWVVISSTGARLKVGGGELRSWWVVGVDAFLIATAMYVGRGTLDEIAGVALVVPVGIMTLRGKLGLSVAMAILATIIAGSNSYHALRAISLRASSGVEIDITVEVAAHTFAWLAIYSMVAFSSRAGMRFLEVSDLHLSDSDLRLEALLDRAPAIYSADTRRLAVRRITEIAREVFDADSASIMRREGDSMVLAGLSRQARYFDPEEEGQPQDSYESQTRVSIADYVAYSDQPLLLNDDITQDARFRNLPSRPGVHSAMSVSMRVGDTHYGVLNITQLDIAAPRFTDADLRVARVLSYLSAIALSRQPG